MRNAFGQVSAFGRQSRVFWTVKLLSLALILAIFNSTPSGAHIAMPLNLQADSGNESSADPLIEITNLQIARKGHTATRLQDGRVLIAGGENVSGPVAGMELFRPAEGVSSLGPNILASRSNHTAVLLSDGRVLITGGRSGGQCINSTEIFDPVSNATNIGPLLNHARAGHSGTVLPDGRYLLIGGDDAGSAEVYDPATGSFTILAAQLGTPRFSHSAALLQNGKILIAGGLSQNGQALSTAELFDPATMSFSPVSNGMHSPRTNATLRVLPGGKVQVIGGDDESTMEMFNADGEYFTAYAHLITGKDSVGKLLRSAGRSALLNLDPKRSGLQSAISMLSSDAAAVISELTGRAGYSLTPLRQSNKVVLAGGGTNSAVATESAFLITNSQDATITTDKTDYHPGETVIITGSGFQSGETVNFLLHVEPLASPDSMLTPSVADENGNFVNSTFIVRERDANVTLTLTATGESSDLVAQTIFTDIGGTSLTINKILVPSTDTGTFNLQIDGVTRGTGANIGNNGTTGSIPVASVSHTVGETGANGTLLSNYSASIICQNGTTILASGSNPLTVTIPSGASAVCTITNTLMAAPPKLTVNTVTVPSADTGRFNLFIDGTAKATDQANGGTIGPVSMSVGSHTVGVTAGTDTSLADYVTVIGGDCAADGTISLAAGDNKTCTITNTLKPGTLIITKAVVTQPTGPVQNFSICVQGLSFPQGNCQGVGIEGGQLTWNNLIPGVYVVSEIDPGTAWIVSGIPPAPVYVAPGAIRNDVTITNTLKISGNLQLTKTATPGTYSGAGQEISYTLSAQNSTSVILTNVTISDPMFPSLNCTQESLQPGVSLNCTASYSTKQSDVDAGAITNTATVTGLFGGQAVSDTKSVTVTSNRNPALSLSKAAVPMTYAVPGVSINYTLIATNTGNVTLSGVAITDAKVGTLTCSPAQPASLVPGAAMTCSSPYVTLQSDIDNGTVKNNASAAGTFANTTVTANASVTVIASQSPGLTLVKTATEANYNSVGDLIHYKLVAANTGNVTLTNVSISDLKIADLNCLQPVSLSPGGSLTCTGIHTVTQADIDSTIVKNTANASGIFGGTTVIAPPASVNVSAITNPHLSLIKSSDSTGYTLAGDTLRYALIATNDGNVTLSNVAISDPKLPALACTPAQPAALAPNAFMTCNGAYSTSQQDVDAGSVTNTAIASGKFGIQTVSDTKTVIVNAKVSSHLSLSKTANPMTYSRAGALVNYSLIATNDGNVTLTSVSITDPKLASINCAQPVTLAPGSVITCTGTYTISQADLDAGFVTNTANAAGTFGSASVPANPASVTVSAAQNEHLSLTKTANPMTFSSVGAVISYRLVASNDGNVTLTGVRISDPRLAALTCAQPASLDPGASLTCTGSYLTTQSDLDAGAITNTAGASGSFSGATVNAVPASATVRAVQTPQLFILKSANPMMYSTRSDVIAYRYLLKNMGNVTLNGPFSVSDNKTTVSCPATPLALAPGASVSCSANYLITKADLIAGSVTNLAIGHAEFSNMVVNSNQASATVTAAIPPMSLACVGDYAPVGKPYTLNLVASGGVLPYTFTIISGALPPGLTLNASTGVISGTPTGAGSFSFTAQVVDYRGNSVGTVASSCGAILIYQESQFVIWGGNPTIPSGQPANITIGRDYMFWGAQWWKQVLGGNWTDNASFKGYANQVDRVNKTWSTRPGNSSGPPDSVSSYISVIVTTQSTKQGSDISGNIAETAILKVDDPNGYGPNPGHSGSGVVVAIIR